MDTDLREGFDSDATYCEALEHNDSINFTSALKETDNYDTAVSESDGNFHNYCAALINDNLSPLLNDLKSIEVSSVRDSPNILKYKEDFANDQTIKNVDKENKNPNLIKVPVFIRGRNRVETKKNNCINSQRKVGYNLRKSSVLTTNKSKLSLIEVTNRVQTRSQSRYKRRADNENIELDRNKRYERYCSKKKWDLFEAKELTRQVPNYMETETESEEMSDKITQDTSFEPSQLSCAKDAGGEEVNKMKGIELDHIEGNEFFQTECTLGECTLLENLELTQVTNCTQPEIQNPHKEMTNNKNIELSQDQSLEPSQLSCAKDAGGEKVNKMKGTELDHIEGNEIFQMECTSGACTCTLLENVELTQVTNCSQTEIQNPHKEMTNKKNIELSQDQSSEFNLRPNPNLIQIPELISGRNLSTYHMESRKNDYFNSQREVLQENKEPAIENALQFSQLPCVQDKGQDVNKIDASKFDLFKGKTLLEMGFTLNKGTVLKKKKSKSNLSAVTNRMQSRSKNRYKRIADNQKIELNKKKRLEHSYSKDPLDLFDAKELPYIEINKSELTQLPNYMQTETQSLDKEMSAKIIHLTQDTNLELSCAKDSGGEEVNKMKEIELDHIEGNEIFQTECTLGECTLLENVELTQITNCTQTEIQIPYKEMTNKKNIELSQDKGSEEKNKSGLESTGSKENTSNSQGIIEVIQSSQTDYLSSPHKLVFTGKKLQNKETKDMSESRENNVQVLNSLKELSLSESTICKENEGIVCDTESSSNIIKCSEMNEENETQSSFPINVSLTENSNKESGKLNEDKFIPPPLTPSLGNKYKKKCAKRQKCKKNSRSQSSVNYENVCEVSKVSLDEAASFLDKCKIGFLLTLEVKKQEILEKRNVELLFQENENEHNMQFLNFMANKYKTLNTLL